MKRLVILLIIIAGCSDAMEDPDYWTADSPSTAVWDGPSVEHAGYLDATENTDSLTIKIEDRGEYHTQSEYTRWVSVHITWNEQARPLAPEEFVYPDQYLLMKGGLDGPKDFVKQWPIEARKISVGGFISEGLRFDALKSDLLINCSGKVPQMESFKITYEDAERTIISYAFPANGMGEAIQEITCQ